MAREDRPRSPTVAAVSRADPLLDEGHRYAFFQALRLLRLRNPDEAVFNRDVRVRPALSLSFPDRDIEAIELDEAGKYRITANFFGLYGVTSPLPTFYTEDLIDQHLQGNSNARDFLDIIHVALYPLLFRAWEKSRLWLTVAERRDQSRLDQLFSLVGLSGQRVVSDDTARTLLPHAGNFNQFPRSALGLQSMVSGLLDNLPVDVEPCVTETVFIPVLARCLLNEQACSLGKDALLGSHINERAGAVRVHIGPLSANTLTSLLPGTPGYDELVGAIALYLKTPLRCMLVLKVDPHKRCGAALSQGCHQLGLNTWLPESVAGDTTQPWPRYDDVFLSIDVESHRIHEGIQP